MFPLPTNPDPGKKTTFFSKAITKKVGQILVFNQKCRNRYFIEQGTCLRKPNILKYKVKIMTNLLKKWIFYSSVSLAGSGSVYRIRIRIQAAICIRIQNTALNIAATNTQMYIFNIEFSQVQVFLDKLCVRYLPGTGTYLPTYLCI